MDLVWKLRVQPGHAAIATLKAELEATDLLGQMRSQVASARSEHQAEAKELRVKLQRVKYPGQGLGTLS